MKWKKYDLNEKRRREGGRREGEGKEEEVIEGRRRRD